MDGESAGEVCDRSGGDGVCVECVEDADCGGDVCSQLDNTSTANAPGSASACEACVSDTQCEEDHACVPMDFAGSEHGTYCLDVFDDQVGCDQPYGILETKTSLGGVNDEFCSLNESLTTCEALDSLKAGASGQCESGGSPDDSVCGAPGLNEGLCRTVGWLVNKCTYECTSQSECPDITGKSECVDDNSSDTMYCGS